jgi:hypothetical protein
MAEIVWGRVSASDLGGNMYSQNRSHLQSRIYDVAGYARKVTLDIVVDNKLNPTAHPGKPLLPRKKSSVVLLPLLK